MLKKLIDKYKGRFLIWRVKDQFIIIDQKDDIPLDRYGWLGYDSLEEVENSIIKKLGKSPLGLFDFC